MRGRRGERSRLRRRRLGALVVLAILACGLVPSSPAAAVPAPLVTEDAVGIRVDETLFIPELVAAAEAALEPTVVDLLTSLAEEHSPVPAPSQIQVEAGVDLAVDFYAARDGAPFGGIALDLALEDIGVTYVVDPPWPFRDCRIEIRPDDGQIAVDTDLDIARLPESPLALDGVDAAWDEHPSVHTTGLCFLYLLDDLLQSLWAHLTGAGPAPIAEAIETRAAETLTEAIATTWEEQVAPILEPLAQYPNFSWGQLYADDHGVIVTLDADGNGGLILPGSPFILPVVGAEDAGSVVDVDDLLGRRPLGGGDLVVTVDPNIANQFIFAFTLLIGGNLGSPAILPLLGPVIEDLLLPPDRHDNYSDTGWFVRLRSTTPIRVQGQPGEQPMGSLPFITAEFRNGSQLVSTFTGSITGMRLDTGIRDFVGNWGPVLLTEPAQFTATRTFANADAALRPAADDMEIYPFVQRALADFTDFLLETLLTFGPLRFGPVALDLCDSCGRYPDDDRYTETFIIPAEG